MFNFKLKDFIAVMSSSGLLSFINRGSAATTSQLLYFADVVLFVSLFLFDIIFFYIAEATFINFFTRCIMSVLSNVCPLLGFLLFVCIFCACSSEKVIQRSVPELSDAATKTAG